jgi:tRNA(Ile)-lysidine synthase
LLKYLEARGLPFVTDSTNRDTAIRRNAVRLKVIPVLQDVCGKDIRRRLAAVANSAGHCWEYISSEARRFISKHVNAEKDLGVLSVSAFSIKSLPQALRAAVLSELAAGVLGEPPRLDARHYVDFDLWLCSESGRREIQLPGRLTVARWRSMLEFTEGPSRFVKCAMRVEGEERLQPPGKARFPGADMLLTARITRRCGGLRKVRGAMQELLDFDAVHGPLTLRGWRDGDRFTPLGAKGTQKLKKLFSDHKIYAFQRRLHPVVADEAGIVWVVGLRIAERVKITPDTRTVLRLRAKLIEPPGEEDEAV